MSRNPNASSRAAPIVRFLGVGLTYDRREALRQIEFDLPAGSFHVLTGASGAGKSSLLKLIYLAKRPSSGVVEVFGRKASEISPPNRPALRRRMGVVFQDFRLVEHLNAFDNAALPLRLAGKRAKAYRDDVKELLHWVGLAERMDALPAELSGGEKQRLAIARAVVGSPDLLLADEPTGNVDPAMAQRLLRLFLELNKGGTTILLATHDETLAAASGAPRLHLDEGRLTRLPV